MVYELETHHSNKMFFWCAATTHVVFFLMTGLNVVFFKTYRKTPQDLIISHLCTKNLDDMIYSF